MKCTPSVVAILACVSVTLLSSSSTTNAFTPVSSSKAFSQASTRLFNAPEPLATEGEWSAYLDEETTGVVYYFNSRTGESRWEPPTKSFPSVYLKPSRRRKAEAKRDEYFKNLSKEEEKEGFVSKLLGGRNKQQTEAEEEGVMKEEEEPGWMKGMLEEKYAVEEPKQGFLSRLLDRSEPPAAPAPAPAPAPAAPAAEEPKIGFLDSVFQSLTETATTKPEPFFAEAGESESEKAARIEEEARKEAAKAKAEEDRIRKQEAQKRKQEEQKRKQEERKALEAQAKAKAEEDKRLAAEAKKKAEEERKMQEMVRKAEAEQKAEADRLEAEARKAEAAEAKRIAEEEKRAAAEAKKAEQAAMKAAAEEQIIVEEKPTAIKIDIGSCVLPHPSKVLWGGEDAVFTKGRTFGVFDGVSGADKTDGLPLYSKMLARQMTQLVGTGNDVTIKDMQDNLLTAAEIADERATGASTAIVASITEDGFLRAINLGDSVCIVVRGDKVVAKTKEIIHYFDCPYQLSDISPDRPRDARKLNFELLRGDVVLMGSDGVFDNLDDAEIVEVVNSGPAKAGAIAKRVSDRSRRVSLNSNAATPYSKQAKRNGDPDFRDGLGGKVDDISCVVARYE